MNAMNSIQIFSNESFGQVRVIENNGEPWFVARDVAVALDYAESSNTTRIFQAIPDSWKGVKPIHTLGGEQEMLTISEQGLYFFLGRSDKSKALPYQMWIAGDVVAAIRKHGGYLTPEKIEEALSDPDTIIRLATDLKAERQRRASLEAQAALDRPKVVFADSIEVSKTSILVGEMAKLIKQSIGYDIGQNRFFEWLRDYGYIHRHGSQKNMPTQRAVESGWIEIKEGTRIGSSGECHITKTPKITGKGQIYFINFFKRLAQQSPSGMASR